MSTQVVINKTVRPLVILVPTSALAGQHAHTSSVLKPGANEVEDEVVAALMASDSAAIWIKHNMLEIPKPTKAGAEGLEGFDLEAASTIINGCYDMESLDSWADSDKRKEVRKAINARKKELQTAAKKRADAA